MSLTPRLLASSQIPQPRMVINTLFLLFQAYGFEACCAFLLPCLPAYFLYMTVFFVFTDSITNTKRPKSSFKRVFFGVTNIIYCKFLQICITMVPSRPFAWLSTYLLSSTIELI